VAAIVLRLSRDADGPQKNFHYQRSSAEVEPHRKPTDDLAVACQVRLHPCDGGPVGVGHIIISSCVSGRVASLNRCKFAGGLRFPGASLGGCHLLVERFAVELLVFDSVEVLAVDIGERRAI
jgi:hypothetical protein